MKKSPLDPDSHLQASRPRLTALRKLCIPEIKPPELTGSEHRFAATGNHAAIGIEDHGCKDHFVSSSLADALRQRIEHADPQRLCRHDPGAAAANVEPLCIAGVGQRRDLCADDDDLLRL